MLYFVKVQKFKDQRLVRYYLAQVMMNDMRLRWLNARQDKASLAVFYGHRVVERYESLFGEKREVAGAGGSSAGALPIGA